MNPSPKRQSLYRHVWWRSGYPKSAAVVSSGWLEPPTVSRINSSKLIQGGFMPKVWLVTGSASGLGRNIAEAVLASGDRLVATARDPRRLEDLLLQYRDHVRTVAHDVADERAAYAAVQAAVDSF